jgi:hypothetical protein
MSFPMSGPDGQANPTYFATQNTSSFSQQREYSDFSNEVLPQPDITANMFAPEDLLYGFEDGNDQGDPKRRRIARVS